MTDAAAQLEGFLDKFSPEVAADVRAMIVYMTSRLPGATILVFDNYNALAIGFGPSAKVGDIVFSLAVYPRWVSLFFGRGTELSDPDAMLRGDGSKVRHIRLTGPEMLADPRVEALIATALALAAPPIDPAATGGLLIKSISARQRPRRPA